jgi:toxin ParE1/3/4
MRRRIEIDDEAKAEARHAFAWYLASDTTVALAFEEELSKAIEIIRDEAHTFPAFEGETRRHLLPTFPYGILFDVVGDVVFIIAIAHLKREPGYWKR